MTSNLFAVSTQGTLVSSPTFWSVAVILISLLLFNLFRAPSQLSRSDAVKSYRSALFPGLGPIQFYSQRNTFLRSIFGHPEHWKQSPPKQNGTRVNSRGHIVTITSNPLQDGKTFFNDRGLHFNQGYEVMFAGVPELPSFLKSKSAEGDENPTDTFVSNLRSAISAKRLESQLPAMIKIIVDNFKLYPAKNGEVDVHKTIYPLVFQISVLLLGLAEHARDVNAAKALEAPFWSFADNTGYMATHFPLLPWPSTVKKWIGAIRMSTEIRSTVEKRIKEGRRENDFVQEMIDRGSSIKSIEDFVMGSLFAAIINSTGVTSYFLLFLCARPELRDRVRGEMEAMIRSHVEERGEDYDALSLQQKLDCVPLAAWEGELPIYTSVLDETMRILMISLLFRRKVTTSSKVTQTPTSIASSKVLDREFVGFWLASAHRNSNIYSDPTRFDPDRFARGEGKGEGEFVPWGSGRHICLGMRFAKLEIRAVHAAFLLNFPDAVTTDGNGKRYEPDDVPFPDQESEHRRYPQKPVSLSYAENPLRK